MQNEERPPDAEHFTYIAAAKYFDPDTQQLDLAIVDALTEPERAEFVAFVAHTIGLDIHRKHRTADGSVTNGFLFRIAYDDQAGRGGSSGQ